MEPEFDLRGTRTETIVKRFYVAFSLALLVLFQQCYARSQECGIEQPIGLLGIAEMYFRHPEALVGQHFHYSVIRWDNETDKSE